MKVAMRNTRSNAPLSEVDKTAGSVLAVDERDSPRDDGRQTGRPYAIAHVMLKFRFLKKLSRQIPYNQAA